jgi:CRP/FNR family transcriptional regulator, cyclic AMP receptor protein
VGIDSPALRQVLLEEPEFADAIPLDRRERAVRECVARELRVPTGPWRAINEFDEFHGIGLLVLRGLVIRRVGVDGRCGAELLGEGDILRPWQHEPDSTTPLAPRVTWTVLEPAALAVLDHHFTPCLGRYPELAGCFVARAIQRARHLAVNMAIVHQARVDVRLHMLLWHLAARWGRVRSDATVLPLRLTHAVLADLVAARRPTVTSALSLLARQGLVRFSDEGWILSGTPPLDLLALSIANGARAHG